MKATEGNGGAPLVLHREPVDKPEIPRGAMFPHWASFHSVPGAERITFVTTSVPGYRLTYHDVQVISDGAHTAVQVFVGPSDVVTWERL